ncbi:MAG: hypothetical protein ACM3OC_04355 [Deltaproteobacteria bacterium]
MSRKVLLAAALSVLLFPRILTAYTTPKDLKDSVTFIFGKNEQQEFVAKGTGFFVCVKDEQNPEKFYTYFVTAKHVMLDPSGALTGSVYIRLNTLDGKSDFLEVPLISGSTSCFFTHSDPSVDILVIPIAVDMSKYKVKFIPDAMLTTPREFLEREITEGDDVFFIGLFTPHIGGKKNYPIIRFGTVALMPEEKVWLENRERDLYLIEAEACGGNSGSPVFFHLAGGRVFLAGVLMGGYWDSRTFDLVDSTKRVEMTNAGIAAVVPAYKLSEVLSSKELREHRQAVR